MSSVTKIWRELKKKNSSIEVKIFELSKSELSQLDCIYIL